jgi:hypothetical protein
MGDLLRGPGQASGGACEILSQEENLVSGWVEAVDLPGEKTSEAAQVRAKGRRRGWWVRKEMEAVSLCASLFREGESEAEMEDRPCQPCDRHPFASGECCFVRCW